MDAPTTPSLTPLLDMVLPAFDPADASGDALPPADQLAIRNLAVRLHLSIDTRQYAAAGVLFADDAELDFQWGHVQGRDAITALYAKHQPDETTARHCSVNELIVRTGPDAARMTSYLMVTQVADPKTGKPMAPHLIGHGVEVMDCRKQDGAWRITRMVQDQTAIDPALAPADAVAYTALTAADRARHDGRAA
jgi:hypothetical protein